MIRIVLDNMIDAVFGTLSERRRVTIWSPRVGIQVFVMATLSLPSGPISAIRTMRVPILLQPSAGKEPVTSHNNDEDCKISSSWLLAKGFRWLDLENIVYSTSACFSTWHMVVSYSSAG